MPKQLPKIKRGKGIYFFDEKLKQLRKVDNPHDCIDLTNDEVWFYKEVAEGRVNTKEVGLVEAAKEV
ncbi:hypothetical protein HYS50_01080 [Candidatus Woesearchaeota archaeon]|nr:hypothetical protein [Candidatus Woesearchaeota archaeon]